MGISEKEYAALLAKSAKASNAAYEKQWGPLGNSKKGPRKFHTEDRRAVVLAFVKANPGLSTDRVAEGLDMNRNTCFDDLSVLRVNGKIRNASDTAHRSKWVAT